MFCTNCGKQIPDSTTFCFYCGAPQEPVINNTMPAVCPNCNNILEPGSTFCTFCGTQISSNVPSNMNYGSFQNNPSTTGGKRCSVCGHINETNATFCVNCGYSFASSGIDHCPNCGSIIDPATGVCAVCGYSAGSSVGTYTNNSYPSQNIDSHQLKSTVNTEQTTKPMTDEQRIAKFNFKESDDFDV